MEAETSLLGHEEVSTPRRRVDDGAGPTRRACASLRKALRFVNVRRRLRDPTHRQLFDLFLVIVAYLTVGTVFYYSFDEHFSWVYSFFYSTNVGLGVGFGNLSIRSVGTKWFTVFYMLTGSSMITGTFGIFFRAAMRSDLSTRHHMSKVLLAGLFYLAAVGFGLVIASEFQDFGNIVDALVFVVSNYTTAGLINPQHEFCSLLFTTISLLIGVPANYLFMAQIARKIFAEYEVTDIDSSSSSDEDEGVDENRFAYAVQGKPLPRQTNSSSDRIKKKNRTSSLASSSSVAGEEEHSPLRNYRLYLEDQLLKSGSVSPGQLEEIRTSFLGRG